MKEFRHGRFFANLGSMGGLKSLQTGLCHIGICHLLQDDNEEYNFDFANQELDTGPGLCQFQQTRAGDSAAEGQPEGNHRYRRSGQKRGALSSTSAGHGNRLLLDYEIARSRDFLDAIDGYQREVGRHIDAGLEVLSGRADAAPAIRAVAGLLDLDFLPLRWERYDLLISRERFFEKGIQDFIGLLHEKAFRAAGRHHLKGYDVSLCGKMLFPDNFTRRGVRHEEMIICIRDLFC